MARGENLYRLQCLDSEADAKRRRLTDVEAALGGNEALRQARQALSSAQTQTLKWTVRQRDLELKLQSLTEKIARFEQQLYGGRVRNPKELSDLQAEVASLRRWQQKLEDDLLAAMIDLDEAEEARKKAQEHLDRTEADWSARQADLMAEREELRARLAELQRAREDLLPQIDAHDRTVYEDLRRRKAGVAVAQVRDGSCSACGVSISAGRRYQLREGKLVCCSNCERILVQV